MPETPDQHLIDELYRNLKDEPSGNGHHKRVWSIFSDEQVIGLCRRAKNAAKFAGLFDDGNTTGYPSPSEADLALVSMLAFYTQDADQIERLFNGSALNRGKWKRSDYRRRTIEKALNNVTETYTPRGPRKEKIHSPVTKEGVAGERIIDLFKTAKQCAEETPADPDWVVYGYVVAGGITKLDGKIKTSGKTTLVTHMVSAIVSGKPFMGYRTKRTKAVILTEQAPSSFRQALKRAALEDTEDVEILYWRDVIDVPWAEVVAAAVERAAQVGAELLVVDTVGQFASIRGDGENSAGEAQNAMRPLQVAAGKGLAVVATYHERKSGGDVGDSGRGSSAFGGAVDIILSLKRGDGNTRESVRVLEGVGRYDETPAKLVIELTNGRYQALGDTTQYAEQEAMKAVVEILPTKLEHALVTGDVHDKVKARAAVGKTAIDEALTRLTETGTIKKIGKGVKGSPHRYYKPDPEQESEPPLPKRAPPEGEEIHSPETPSYTRENESEAFGGEQPLSSDLGPGESATLEELQERRKREDEEADPLAAFLEDPPEWLVRQAENARRNPALLKSTCATVAYEVLGYAGRGPEIKEHLEQWIHNQTDQQVQDKQERPLSFDAHPEEVTDLKGLARRREEENCRAARVDSGEPPRRARRRQTEEEVLRVQKLISEGVAAEVARAEVLGGGELLYYHE